MIFVALGKKNGNSKEIDVAPVLCLLYGNKQVEIKSHNLSINLLSFLSMPTFGSFTRNSYIQVNQFCSLSSYGGKTLPNHFHQWMWLTPGC